MELFRRNHKEETQLVMQHLEAILDAAEMNFSQRGKSIHFFR